MNEEVRLLGYGPGKSRMTVPQGTGRYASYKIERLAAVTVPHLATPTPGEHNRRSAVRIEKISTRHSHEII